MLCKLREHSIFVLLATLFATLCVDSSFALEFNINYISKSTPLRPYVRSHPEDPDGSKLVAHLERAAADWSALIDDTWTMNLTVYYATEDEVGTTTASVNPAAATKQQFGSGSNAYERIISGDIRVYENIDAYFDPTPNDDVEFTLRNQTLLSRYNSSNLEANGYLVTSGAAPLLEIGNELLGNSAAVDKKDLLTVMRHEIGHYMGFNTSSNAERSDGDYDLPPSLLGGAEVAVLGRIVYEQEDEDSGEVPDELENPTPVYNADGSLRRSLGHVQGEKSLMSARGQTSATRRDISAADVFTVAAANGWSSLNLQRVDYIGTGGNFLTAASWTDGRTPDSTDSVAIRNGAFTNLSADRTVAQLTVAGGSNLFMPSDDTLLVTGPLTLGTMAERSNSLNSTILLGPRTTLRTRDVNLESGSLTLANAELNSSGDIHNLATIYSSQGGSQINVTGTFFNNGRLVVTGPLLTITGPFLANPTADLDGVPFGPGSTLMPGEVDAMAGSLKLNIANAETFSGTMSIGAGQYIDLPNAWQLTGGTLTLAGSATQVAELRGGDVDVQGTVIVDRQGRFVTGVNAASGSQIRVPDANDSVTFADSVSFNSGFHTGNGSHSYEADMTINNGRVDVGSITVPDGGSVTINGGFVAADNIENDTKDFNVVDGILKINRFTGDLQNQGGTLQYDQAKFTGDYVQGEDAELSVTIGGTGEDESSMLSIEGSGTLAGAVKVALDIGYTPTPGDEFIILTSDSELQFADELTLTGFAAPMFELFTQDNLIGLLAIAQPVDGDYNDDGRVDMADYTVWRDNLGGPPGTLPNDPGNGAIGSFQYTTWKNNLGAQSAATTFAGQAVPEPSSIALMVTLVLGVQLSVRQFGREQNGFV